MDFFALHFDILFNNNKNFIGIEIDNEFEYPSYEKDLSFQNYSSNLKPIAIYYPKVFDININEFISNKFNTKSLFINKTKLKSEIKTSVKIAKNHGIYGFGIYYIYYNNHLDSILNQEINIFSNDKYINFPYFLIWKNENFNYWINRYKNKCFNFKNKLELKLDKFVKAISKYMDSNLYIKLNDKPILSINNPFNMSHLQKSLLIIRKKMKENKIGDIYILYPFYGKNNITQKENLFDGIYDLSKIDLFTNKSEKKNIYYYSGMIYKNNFNNKLKIKPDFFLCSTIETRNKILKFYSPEKYYLLNKVIINWTEKNYNNTNGIFFISSWNNLNNGNYLLPDKRYGYSSLNSFSKALFNLSYEESIFNFIYLKNTNIIAIQAHLFYIDLLPEIINKTNNIPFLYDLFITIVFPLNYEYIEENLKKHSKANKYEILIVENKGRDVLPFLIQMKDKIKEYKYICHIHTKKSLHNPELGNGWRNYLINNLLGSKSIITNIIYDFEMYEKLGIIFPDFYYKNINGENNLESSGMRYHRPNIKYMNYILANFGNFKIGKKLIFPNGNMFWAKIKSIHQLFEIASKIKFPDEGNQINGTIMHAFERIWLYIAKLNGYYYKIIFERYC